MARDAAEAAIEILQANSGVTDLVTGGAANILDSGEMRVDTLASAEEARRAVAGTGVLGISVQDAGETLRQGDLYQQTVVIRPLNRLTGFNPIRAIRFAIYDALQHQSAALSDGQGAVVEFRYASRTGHRVDRTYNVHFEAATFTATVQKMEV